MSASGRLLLAPDNAAAVGGPERIGSLAVTWLSLGRGTAGACRQPTAAQIALACSPKEKPIVV
jgi:hypothetical protein